MKETGNGIQCEEDIDMSLDNSFTNKWGKSTPSEKWQLCSQTVLAEIKQSCPWYWDMEALIGERPNKKPAGLGNSRTPIDFSVLTKSVSDAAEVDPTTTTEDDATSSEATGQAMFEMDIDDGAAPGSPEGAFAGILENDLNDFGPLPAPSVGLKPDEIDGEDGIEVVGMAKVLSAAPAVKQETHKRKAIDILSESETTTATSQAARTPARPGSSKLAQAKGSSLAKRSKVGELNEAVVAEESTRQKELDVDRVRYETTAKIKLETLKTSVALAQQKSEAKRERREMKKQIELQRLKNEEAKLRYAQEYRMEQLRIRSSTTTSKGWGDSDGTKSNSHGFGVQHESSLQRTAHAPTFTAPGDVDQMNFGGGLRYEHTDVEGSGMAQMYTGLDSLGGRTQQGADEVREQEVRDAGEGEKRLVWFEATSDSSTSQGHLHTLLIVN